MPPESSFAGHAFQAEKIQSRLLPNIQQSKKTLEIPKLPVRKNNPDDPEPIISILKFKNNNFKSPRSKSSLNVPPPFVIESPRVKGSNGYNSSDSDDDLLLPTEMAQKINQNANPKSQTPFNMHKPNTDAIPHFVHAQPNYHQPNSLPSHPPLPDFSMPKKQNIGMNLPPLFYQNENMPNVGNTSKPHKRLLSDGLVPPLVAEQKSKTPTKQQNWWNDDKNDDFAPIAFGSSSNSARDSNDVISAVPPTCDTPSRLMLEMKIHEAQETVDRLIEKWGQNIEEQKNNARIRMERLLNDHALEMSKLDREFGVSSRKTRSPSVLIAPVKENSKILRARKVNVSNSESEIMEYEEEEEKEEVSLAYLEKRKELVAKHSEEIIALNNECKNDLQNLLERKEKELERPRSKLETLVSEFNTMPGTRMIQVRRETRLISPHREEKKGDIRLTLIPKPL